MEELNPLQTYLYNLGCAKAEIVPDAPIPVRFNGADSPGSFFCNLVAGELASVCQLLLFSKRSRRDSQLMQAARDQFSRFNRIYQQDEQLRVKHCHLMIVQDNRLVTYQSLSKKEQQYIDIYLAMQFESFCRQRDLFFHESKEVADLYQVHLSDTELIEMAMGLYAGCRVECLNGTASRIGFTRYLASRLALAFPANYAKLCKQLRERNSPTLFLDRIRKSFIAFLRK